MLEADQPENRVSTPPPSPRFIEGIASGITRFVTGIRNGGYRDEPLTLDPPRVPQSVRLDSREDESGVITLRPGNGDAIVIFSGSSFLQNFAYLKNASATFLCRNAEWDPDFCKALMDKGMGVDELTWGARLNSETIARIVTNPKKEREIPSVFLFRDENAPKGDYLGVSVQRKTFIKTDLIGEVSVLDNVLRAFEPGYRGKHRGRLAVGLALICHGGAMFFIHKTGNPLAAYTNTLSEYLVQEDAHPWGKQVITNPLMQEVREKSAKFILLPGRIMLPNGVIKGDYPKPNRGFNAAELRGGALDMYKRMKEQQGMRLEEDGEGKDYDSVAPLYRVR